MLVEDTYSFLNLNLMYKNKRLRMFRRTLALGHQLRQGLMLKNFS